MKSKDFVRAFDHEVLRTLRKIQTPRAKILVAVSGGLDSMTLLRALVQWQPLLKYELVVGHVHHGPAPKAQLRFRNQAQALVEKVAREYGFEFKTAVSESQLKTEADFRDFRWSQLNSWSQDFVAVAHHADDLLETQLLKLIRGASPRALAKMTQRDGVKIRPLLNHSRASIEKYARIQKLQWCEDPSNRESDSLRNFLRNEWLPRLEHKRKGSLKSLAKSMQMIAETNEMTGEPPAPSIWANGGVRRNILTSLSKKQQSVVVVEYLNRMGLFSFERTHINEILRRLDTGRKSSTFSLLGLSWSVSPDLILASRV